ncbi:hypothetical protein TRVL_00627 [Trypanosoma vivax]|nr:hypothetical protein TRVL_00627 [Trypanosoma vivax]
MQKNTACNIEKKEKHPRWGIKEALEEVLSLHAHGPPPRYRPVVLPWHCGLKNYVGVDLLSLLKVTYQPKLHARWVVHGKGYWASPGRQQCVGLYDGLQRLANACNL